MTISRQTSHGIVLASYITHEAIGVHRYKPELWRYFYRLTPNVEVPNLPVDVDSWGR